MSLLFFAWAALAQEPAPVEAPPVEAPGTTTFPLSIHYCYVPDWPRPRIQLVSQGAVLYPHELPRGYQQSLARTVTVTPGVTPNFLANQPQLQLDGAPLLPVRGRLSATSPPRPVARPMMLVAFDPR